MNSKKNAAHKARQYREEGDGRMGISVQKKKLELYSRVAPEGRREDTPDAEYKPSIMLII